MSEKLWEKVNQLCDEDVLDIVMGLVNQRIRAGEAVDKIVKRSGVAVEVFTKDLKQQCDDLLVACEVGLSYINAIVCKVPRPITELKEDKELVESVITKAKKGFENVKSTKDDS